MNVHHDCRTLLPNLIRALLACCAAMMLAFSNSAAQAGVMLPAPDITVSSVTVMYNASSSQTLNKYGVKVGPNGLFVMGYANTLKLPDSVTQQLYYGNGTTARARFTLNAVVDNSGNLVSGSGSFSVMGSTTQNAGTTIPLLSGTLTDLNSAAFTSAGIIELSATTTGGQFASIFGNDIVMSIGSLGSGKSFAANFMVMGVATADIGRPVPEPSAACLWFVGASILGMRRRRN